MKFLNALSRDELLDLVRATTDKAMAYRDGYVLALDRIQGLEAAHDAERQAKDRAELRLKHETMLREATEERCRVLENFLGGVLPLLPVHCYGMVVMGAPELCRECWPCKARAALEST